MREFQSIGVVHLLPLPGSPAGGYTFPQVLERALADADTLLKNGINGIIVENLGDAPFYPDSVPPHVPAMMSIIAHQIRVIGGGKMFLGINVLRNDVMSALAIAAAAQADFVRVNIHTGSAWTDQGLIHGKAHLSLPYRNALMTGEQIQIAADILVKHAKPAGPDDLTVLAKDTFYRGRADYLILTGQRTGGETSIRDIELARKAVPEARIWVGSGTNASNLHRYLPLVDGVIIGSYLHEDGDLLKPLCSKRVSVIKQIISKQGL